MLMIKYVNPYNAEQIVYELWRPEVFFQFEIIINVFEYLQCGDRLYTSESDVCRRQILTYKDGPRAGRVNADKKIFWRSAIIV